MRLNTATGKRHMIEFLHPSHLSATIHHAGPWGPMLYMVVIAVSVVVSQIPGAPLAVVAGTLWSPLMAGVYTVIGGFSGALIAYGLGRWVGQPLVKALTGKTLSFDNEQSGQALGWLVFVTRLLPVVSFDLVSYGAGIARLSMPTYAGATLFGMMPSTFLLTYMGDRIHFTASATLVLGEMFVLLFVGMPLLLYRYNWLNIRTLLSWS
ncbi:MAG: TVP38/TMEM64 family protein [Cyanobacteria bacterium J06560_6]